MRLGPTFIKIGQQFSTRGDVLSREFVQELEKLQDNVPAFDSATAVTMLEEELGRPVGAAYASFSRTPLAAASLGQVHYATLAGGEPVVVKIQRPGLKRLFDIDLKNIRVLAQWLQRVRLWLSYVLGGISFNWRRGAVRVRMRTSANLQ